MSKHGIAIYEGETIELMFEPEACGIVVVQSAEYVVLDGNAQPVQSGNCEINGTLISLILQPLKEGYYSLWITYTVAPNTLKERCGIHVYCSNEHNN